MADPNERDAKLIQYLQEAYGKEQELVQALTADITATTRAAYKKRLKQHLKETKAHAKALERRIKKLGGSPSAVQKVAGKVAAAAKAPVHALRGEADQERMLKNAKTQFAAEQEEISQYLALESFALKVSDSDTAKLARDILREEERMAKFLASQLKQLAGAVATAAVPAAQRRPAGKTKRSARKAGAKSKSTAGKAASKSKSSSSRRPAKKSTARKATAAKPRKAKAKGAAKAK